LTGPRMLDTVVERLLGHAVQRHLQVGGHALKRSSVCGMHIKRGHQVRPRADVDEQMLQTRHEAKLVELRRPQPRADRSERGDNLVRGLAPARRPVAYWRLAQCPGE